MPKHKFLRRITAALLLLGALCGGTVVALRSALPDTFTVETGQPLTIASLRFLTVQPVSLQGETAPAGSPAPDSSQNQVVTLLGIPIKTVRTVSETRREVSVCGTPFGIKMFSDGALVVAFSDLHTDLGTENPAKEAGLRLGDLIISAGGQRVRNNEELTAAITAADGQAIPVVYRRGDTEYTCTLTPVLDRDAGVLRAGVWVRDSSAGIGTLTFTNPANGTFAGLGHAISDSDTGADLTLLSGEIVPVVITGCQKGSPGAPGELKGKFAGEQTLGVVSANETTGVYGRLSAAVDGTQMPVANPQEIELGEAEILTTVSGTEPRRYTIRIERVNMTADDPNRNLQIRVTDPDLLAATGGIVQGLSGSPILQNDRLVGAVTHVLVNDPTRGYGIFATTMLQKADSLA
ncbi:MAG: SpoIVB peptidase [Gemmiger sp.]|uniref:SpoIVB peptidase n=1 Tax=Gemmiger sp. TaxID=2049027 RepID=UPI002E788C64|nr:SpoIVB peptidase [Gemmiger sp.]MEE0801452.1 SpoIVB peptidase [Gemmiger sp.]